MGSTEASRQNDCRTSTFVYQWYEKAPLPGLGSPLLTAWIRKLVLIPALMSLVPGHPHIVPLLFSSQHGPCPFWLGSPLACCRGCYEVQEWDHAGGVTGLIPGARVWSSLRPCPESHR